MPRLGSWLKQVFINTDLTNKKMTKKVLYKHINSGILQAAEDPSEITLRYLTPKR